MSFKNPKALTLLFSASMISNVAQGFTLLSIPWYFALDKASASFNQWYMLITFCSMFWGLYAGTLVDRYNRKKLFLVLNGVQGALLLAAAAYGYGLGEMPHWVTAAVFATTIFGFSVHYPNIYALLQAMTTSENYTKVTSIMEVIGQSMTVVAGALITVLLAGYQADWSLLGLGLSITVAPWQMSDIFLLDGITYVVALLMISFMRYQPVAIGEVERGSVIKRLKTGLSFLGAQRHVLIFGLASYSVFAITILELHGLMPSYVKLYLEGGARTIGFGEIAYGGGALCAGLFIGRLFSALSKLQGVLVLMLLSVFSFVAMGLSHSFGLFYLFSISIGLSNAGVRVLRVAWLFNHVPNGVIGRVNSVFSMANTFARGVLLGLFGLPYFTSSGQHVPLAYFISGGFVLASLLLLIRHKSTIEKMSTY